MQEHKILSSHHGLEKRTENRRFVDRLTTLQVQI